MHPSTELPVHHRPGSHALVEIAIPGTANETEFKPCTVRWIRSADDRPYRLIVETSDGECIGPCAPECVVPLNSRP